MVVTVDVDGVDGEVSAPGIFFRVGDEFDFAGMAMIDVFPFFPQGRDVDFDAVLKDFDRAKAREIITGVRQEFPHVVRFGVRDEIKVGVRLLQEIISCGAADHIKMEAMLPEDLRVFQKALVVHGQSLAHRKKRGTEVSLWNCLT